MFFMKLFDKDYDNKISRVLRAFSIFFISISIIFFMLFIFILFTVPGFYILIFLGVSLICFLMSLLFIVTADNTETVDLIILKLHRMNKEHVQTSNNYNDLNEFEKIKIIYMYKQLYEDNLIEKDTFEKKKKDLIGL